MSIELSNTDEDREVYEMPKVVDLGSVEDVTQGSKPGTHTDKFGSLSKI